MFYQEAFEEKLKKENILLQNLKSNFDNLNKLLNNINSEWVYHDGVYRFYHGSFKTYYLQNAINNIVSELKNLLPEQELNSTFLQIVKEATAEKFKLEHNKEWDKHTRPILEGFFHAKFFLEMAVDCAKTLEEPPNVLPINWAAFLYLYNLR